MSDATPQDSTVTADGSTVVDGTAALELFDPVDDYDRRLARDSSGLLGRLNAAGVLTAADLHVARTLARAAGGVEEGSADASLLAAALATHAVRTGSIAVDLARLDAALRELDPPVDLPWADPQEWTRRLEDGSLMRKGALVLQHGLVYLQRYHHQEVQVVTDLLARAGEPPPTVDETLLSSSLQRVFPDGWEEQREAARVVLGAWTSVLTGGPGTGKTSTVAGVLALLAEQAGADHPLRVGLAAPTGKAATRMQEAVSTALREILDRTSDPATRALIEPLQEVQSVTLHRLLGRRPDSATRFRHDRGHRLPHDVVLVDETSMVSLTHMARLLEALRPTTRLILVGDPDQLVSVDAGAVLADVVAGAAASATPPLVVARLHTSHRFGATIGELAQALRDGDADRVVGALQADPTGAEVTWVQEPDAAAYLRPVLMRHALAIRRAAADGDDEAALAQLRQHRLLCAHREGPWGVRTWNRHVEGWLREETADPLYEPMYLGRPLLVTANDYVTGVFNGDTGVVVQSAKPDGTPVRMAVVEGSAASQRYAPSRLGDVDTMHAMTIHKAQGSQAREITVLLPDVDSPLLTRELFYTAITRAEERVRVVGSEAAVRLAVARRVQRASGLRQRLAG